MGELSSLPNIGKELESQLAEAGITTIEQLKAAGSRAGYINHRL